MSKLPWPFIGAEALSNAVLPERALRKSYDQLYPGVFVPRGVEVSARQRAEAAWLWSKRRGVVAGQSAAALLGAKWVDGRQHAELIHDNRKPPARLIVRTETLAPGEALGIGALQVTTPARTAFDIGRHTLRRIQAIQRLDALANATSVTVEEVEAVALVHPGIRGLTRLRAVLPMVDGGAESPQETVARLALIDAGLPAPQTQFEIFGKYGEFIARVDMAYDDVKVAIEYDGPLDRPGRAATRHRQGRRAGRPALACHSREQRPVVSPPRHVRPSRVHRAARARTRLVTSVKITTILAGFRRHVHTRAGVGTTRRTRPPPAGA